MPYFRRIQSSARLSSSRLSVNSDIYIPSNYFRDTVKHEHPREWTNTRDCWMEKRELFNGMRDRGSGWRLDVQNQYLNKQKQLYNSLLQNPYDLREANMTITHSIAAPACAEWEWVDDIQHFKQSGTRRPRAQTCQPRKTVGQ